MAARRLVPAVLLAALAAAQEPTSHTTVHWAFVAPVRPAVPSVRTANWARNDVDRFVLARLEQEDLAPSPEATRGELLRRVTFDLTGLPPTRDELEAFIADTRPDAYERVVDRLLDTPAAAEESTRLWLDLCRYADTHGMQRDNERALWRWRDWVIDAYARHVPYDRFLGEQLAGDLLPAATIEQRIATGFLRCNPSSDEGGLIPEEYLTRYAMNRTDTFGTLGLGLTVGCAQCHDHKYDPIPQRDYYRLLAYFASFAEDGNDGGALAPAPAIRAPRADEQKEMARRQTVVAAAKAKLAALPAPVLPAWTTCAARASGAELVAQADGSLLAHGAAPATGSYEVHVEGAFAGVHAIRITALPDASLPAQGPGRADNGNFVLTEVQLTVLDADGNASACTFASATAPFAQDGFPPTAAIDGDAATGWAVQGRHDALSLDLALASPLPANTTHLVLRLHHDSRYPQHLLGHFAVAITRARELLPIALSPWRVLGPDAEASGVDVHHPDANGRGWRERRELVDAAVHALEPTVGFTWLRRTLTSPTARTLHFAFGSDDGVRFYVDGDERLAHRVQRGAARGQEHVAVDVDAGDHELLLLIENTGGPSGFAFELDGDEHTLVPAHVRDARAAVTTAEAEVTAYEATLPLCMVTQDLATPRAIHVLRRGRYDDKQERVEPGTPAFLPPLPADAPHDRRALATWLFLPGQPLTARVEVNRAVLRHFGQGLLTTPHDFGAKGARPSHPELLDWLAVEFEHSGWDQRHLHRLLVTSATYRQSSRARADLQTRDPSNVLLARQNRLRLPAEAIRDQALAVSDLLVRDVGGASVRPYHPSGVWESIAFPGSNTEHYVRDNGPGLYRRSLYTFWKRTAPPAFLATLDAPSREQCTVDRPRTNTPLQALALLGDEGYVEASRVFAARVLHTNGQDHARLDRAFKDVTQRAPTVREQELLAKALQDQRDHFAHDEGAASQLIHVGASAPPKDLDARELAAWTMLANLLLNLDEALHR